MTSLYFIHTFSLSFAHFPDVNDNPPEFASHTYYTTVMESASLGSDIVRVLATSRDSGKNAEISYSIIGGNEHRKFSINQRTGIYLFLWSLSVVFLWPFSPKTLSQLWFGSLTQLNFRIILLDIH